MPEYLQTLADLHGDQAPVNIVQQVQLTLRFYCNASRFDAKELQAAGIAGAGAAFPAPRTDPVCLFVA
jgi:hypothetical protein